ncbi:MAG: OadG family protein [Muribaculaceae bacterium]|nr:OadG family protein [Muribaculaceae bacterium]
MKKIILTAALFLTLAASPCMGQTAGSVEGGAAIEVVQTEETVQDDASSPTLIVADATPSEEVNTIEESPVARRMTQAEKAHNAAVNDSWGGAITIIAMCIVISALVILSLLFMGFGKVSEKLLSRNKRQAAKAAFHEAEHHEVDSGEVIAAISMALAEHFQGGHDYEDTILTIRRMKRAYSPWNSKIYNIRHEPPLKRNGFGL